MEVTLGATIKARAQPLVSYWVGGGTKTSHIHP